MGTTKDDMVQVLDDLMIDNFGMQMAIALDSDSGCYVGAGRGNHWMSPKKCAEMMIEACNAALREGDTDEYVEADDFHADDEDEDDEEEEDDAE